MKKITTLTATALMAAALSPAASFADEKMINSILKQHTPMRIVLIMYQETYPDGTLSDFRADNPEHEDVQMDEWLEEGDTFRSPIGRSDPSR